MTNSLSLGVGVPPSTPDVTRAWDGQLYGALIFRATHTPQQVCGTGRVACVLRCCS